MTTLESKTLQGWAYHKPFHHGKYHFLLNKWTSLCGQWKIRPEEESKIIILDNPRQSKLCQRCLEISGKFKK